MPYIAINTSAELSAAQKEKIKTELGRLITILPTKTEAGLLVDFSGGRTMYRAGQEASCAFIDVRLFHQSELDAKKQFTKETFEMLAGELNLKPEHMYLNIIEFDNWGSGGIFK
jgi:phenylpyruvate tautomerase PptA (4-oxalocrotonate tautomerase family)